MGGGWKNFKEYDEKSLGCLEQNFGRNTMFKMLVRNEENYRKILNCLRESLNLHEQTISRNLDFKTLNGLRRK